MNTILILKLNDLTIIQKVKYGWKIYLLLLDATYHWTFTVDRRGWTFLLPFLLARPLFFPLPVPIAFLPLPCPGLTSPDNLFLSFSK